MSTWRTMYEEIENELRRGTGYRAQVKTAIAAAIEHHESKRFAFNEAKLSFTTVADQEYYDDSDDADIPYITRFDSVVLSRGTSWKRELIKKPSDWIDRQLTITSSDPEHYAYIRSQIRLHPAPSVASDTVTVDGVLVLRDSGQTAPNDIVSRATAASIADGFTNAWFVEGYEMIKHWAKGYLYANLTRNAAEAENMFTMSRAFFSRLTKDHIDSSATGFVQPTSF